MNFNVTCPNCGAISAPTVGICPYCKSVMAPSASAKQNASVAMIQQTYDQGNIEQALVMATAYEKQNADFIKDAQFVILYTQITIESLAPSSKTKSLLNQALVANPQDSNLLEYLEVVEAESHLTHSPGNEGEVALMNIIRRSPNNVHALFILGRHLFWEENNPQAALRYLESCVRLRPNFSRAKGCLGAVYKALNMTDMSQRIMNDVASKATDVDMQEYFRNFANS